MTFLLWLVSSQWTPSGLAVTPFECPRASVAASLANTPGEHFQSLLLRIRSWGVDPSSIRYTMLLPGPGSRLEHQRIDGKLVVAVGDRYVHSISFRRTRSEVYCGTPAIDETLRRSGLGSMNYLVSAWYWRASTGLILRSDTERSSGSQALWERFVAQGFATVVDYHFVFKPGSLDGDVASALAPFVSSQFSTRTEWPPLNTPAENDPIYQYLSASKSVRLRSFALLYDSPGNGRVRSGMHGDDEWDLTSLTKRGWRSSELDALRVVLELKRIREEYVKGRFDPSTTDYADFVNYLTRVEAP